MIAFFVPVVITVTLVSFIMKPLYQSSVTIQLAEEKPTLLDFKKIYRESQSPEYYETQLNILKSNALAKRVVGRLPEEIEKELEHASDKHCSSSTPVHQKVMKKII